MKVQHKNSYKQK